jgi:malonate transporter and related proteins
MAYTIAGALLPIVITFLLGFVGAWRGDFRREDAPILNRLVMTYALPLMLFTGTLSTSRANLIQDVPLVVALCVAIVGMYGVVFVLSRVVFGVSTGTSALAALAASAGAVPFMGPDILGHFFGQTSVLPIAIASLVINLTVVPATILFLSLDPVSESRERTHRVAPGGEYGVPEGLGTLVPEPVAGLEPQRAAVVDRDLLAGFDRGDSHQIERVPGVIAIDPGIGVVPRPAVFSAVAGKLGETVQQPLVWAPLVAFAGVLIGVPAPRLLLDAAPLLGHATGGVSLFAAGVILASNRVNISWQVILLVLLKNVVQPALVLGGLRWLGYGNPILSEAVLTTAIPAVPIVVMLALEYRIAEAMAASSLFFSVIGSVITLTVFILLTN